MSDLKLQISDITINYTKVPLGIDTHPVFGWRVSSKRFESSQSAYQIKVYSSKEAANSKKGDMWDSGMVHSSQSRSVPYGGSRLASVSTYYCTVRVWDNRYESVESEPLEFRTGIFQGEPWQGRWIQAPSKTPKSSLKIMGGEFECKRPEKPNRAAVLLRKEFELNGDVAEATVYMSGIGYSLLFVNGRRTDDCFIDPCNTQYNKTVLYRAFDVTELLVSNSKNAVAIELGNGFYNEEGGVWNWDRARWRDNPKLLFYMVVRYTDKRTQTIVSDGTWKATSQGPITFNSIYYGEYHDARLEKKGWKFCGYDDSLWDNAVYSSAPAGKLVCQLEQPVRRKEEFKAEKIKKLDDCSFVVYCPEMTSGWIRLRINGAVPGQTVTLTYGEKLDSDGNVQKLGGVDGINSSWWPETYIMTDKYTAFDDGETYFEPRFSYKGFRYVQIWNYPGELSVNDIKIYRVRNDVEKTGYFNCSNALINSLHDMMVTTCLNNLQGKPTDTPVWEKNGWLGDFNVAVASMNFNFDMELMTLNFLDIIKDCFEQYGLVPPMVPTAEWNINENFVWSSLYIFAMAETYKTYGSLEYVERNYDALIGYADKVSSVFSSNAWVCPDSQLGDWVSPMGKDPKARYFESPSEGSGIVGSAMVYMMFRELAKISDLLGRSDKDRLEEYMRRIYEGFNTKFYNENKGIYETTVWTQYGERTKYRQSSNIMALSAGLVPEQRRQRVIYNLIEDIKSKKNHLDTGCVGTKFILPLLTKLGFGEIAYSVITNTAYPSWGYMADKGTSLWEMWEDTSRSLDHYFLGTYDEWLYAYLAGVQDIDNGYERFTIAPFIPKELTYVTCKINTIRGELESSWKKDGKGNVTLSLKIPFGARAKICPLRYNSFSLVELEGQGICEESFTLGSGRYTLICRK